MEAETPIIQEPQSDEPDKTTATAGAGSGGDGQGLEQTGANGEEELIIVGIGASAGGLQAIQQFFDATPSDSGMAFVIVTHLSPEHVSHLPGLLQTHTEMPVTEVTRTVQMEANHVYVIPPNRYLSAMDSHLRLSRAEETQRPRSPIDHFFRTLGDTHGEQAVGVILSGTGSDGSLGIKRIKEWNGLVIVQDPAEAEYDGMPQSALNTGVVDVALPVRNIPARLLEYASTRPRLPLQEDSETVVESVQETIQRILTQVRGHTGHDFSRYKPSTINRRIARRMQILQIEEVADYLNLLRRNREEVQALFKDLLITVTNFFRDREAFDFLEGQVIPLLFRDKAVGDQIRVWVVGCATGEEAYSVAMLLMEYAGRLDHPPDIQLFASDLSDEALARAREGLYPEVINADVAPERLERYFSLEPGGYRVRKEVRERILFAPHNLLKDPPFSKIDLITCRNLLIYFKREAQRQIFELFHYALQPNGYLFLGPSETVERMELFREVNKRFSVFQSIPTVEKHLPPTLSLGLSTRTLPFPGVLEPREMIGSGAIYQQMLDRYASPTILINSDYTIVHLSELAGRYLQQPGGEPTNNILRRILPPLRLELTTILYRAFQKEIASTTKPVQVMVEGKPERVSLRIHPATDPALKGFALIAFDVVADETTGEQRPAHLGDGTAARDLEEELEQTKRRLQTTIEEFETSKEEMKAANEELLSMNEELRSTAEELETSKEELQSMNEELITLNQENKNKVDELSRLSSDLQNLLTATGIATLFLDRELRIKRFTPRIAELFNIMHSDRGRPLAHLTHRLGYDNLLEDTATVLRTLVPIEREIQSHNGRWHLTRLIPYRTIEDRIDGVVITFVDINELVRTQQELKRRVQQQAVVALLGRLGLGGVELDALFEQATRHICETLGVQFCEVLTLRPDRETLLLKAGFGWDSTLLGKLTVPAKTRSQASYTLQANEPVLVSDWAEEKRFRPLAYISEQGIVSSASVVIPGLQQPYGVLRAHSTEKYLFSSDEVEFLHAVAHLLAEAVERKQVEARLITLNETLEQRVEQRTEQVRNLASELIITEQRVRQRISQILHADIQQLIFATQMTLQFVTKALPAEEHAATLGELEQAKAMVDEALRLTRQLTLDLSPPILQGQDLNEALQWLVTYMHELHKLRVDLQAQHIPQMSNNDMPLLLFQIVRELLFNVVKHAEVSQAEVRVFSEDGNLIVQVIDEGVGFDVPTVLANPPHDSGYGLLDMAERLGLFDATLNVSSEPDKGTTITVTVPQDGDKPPVGDG